MVGLADLVNDSLARNGIQAQLDPRRLQWSKWFRCESCFSFLIVPDQSGVFVLAEEIVAAGEISATDAKRILAIYRVSETDDLGLTMGRLFLPGGPERPRLANGRCFARYAVIEDDQQRQTAHAALLQWMEESAVAATGIVGKESKWEGIETEMAVPATLSPGL
jgi:hypothetical protein